MISRDGLLRLASKHPEASASLVSAAELGLEFESAEALMDWVAAAEESPRASSHPLGSGWMHRVAAQHPGYGRSRTDSDGLPLRDSSLMLQTQPLYGVSYAAIPKSHPEDMPTMSEFTAVVLDPRNTREIEMPSSRIDDALRWRDERAKLQEKHRIDPNKQLERERKLRPEGGD